jgi:hypothetical protein
VNLETALAHFIRELRCKNESSAENKELNLEMLRHANAVLVHAKGFMIAWEKLQKRNGSI